LEFIVGEGEKPPSVMDERVSEWREDERDECMSERKKGKRRREKEKKRSTGLARWKGFQKRALGGTSLKFPAFFLSICS
jgi:hypothetical protein